MGWRIALSVASASLLFGDATAQPYYLGQELATRFLLRQAHVGSSRDQIVVIHAQAGSAMLIDRRDSGSVVYLRGDGSFVWAQIAEQLQNATTDEGAIHVR